MYNKQTVNKTISVVAGILATGMGCEAVSASVLAPNTTYDMFIRTGTSCYSSGNCTELNNGATDNGSLVNFNGQVYGSSIGGDGWAGIIRFMTDNTGDNLTGVSYNMDQYQDTPPDKFVTWTDDPSLMSGTIDANGNMTFTPTGRLAVAGLLTFMGIQPWNIDSSLGIPAPSNTYVTLTTGTSTGQSLTADQANTPPTSLTGSALVADGNGGWNGLLVSSSNFGEEWSLFSATPYTEVWDVNIQAVSTVPIPAAIWLFGSGLIALLGVARKKKAV